MPSIQSHDANLIINLFSQYPTNYVAWLFQQVVSRLSQSSTQTVQNQSPNGCSFWYPNEIETISPPTMLRLHHRAKTELPKISQQILIKNKSLPIASVRKMCLLMSVTPMEKQWTETRPNALRTSRGKNKIWKTSSMRQDYFLCATETSTLVKVLPQTSAVLSITHESTRSQIDLVSHKQPASEHPSTRYALHCLW